MFIALGDSFYKTPDKVFTTIDSKPLKKVLLDTGGSIQAQGKTWDIVVKHLGVSVYRVTLKEKVTT